MKNQYIFVTVGVPACGKSRFYHQIAEKNEWSMGDTPNYISSDDIREELFGSAYDQSNNAKIFEVFQRRAIEALRLGQSVYLDATHRDKSWRDYALKYGKEFDVPVIALYFDVPFFTLWKRDRKRTRHVGFRVLWTYFWKLQLPTTTEGFDTIFRIDRNGQYTEMEW